MRYLTSFALSALLVACDQPDRGEQVAERQGVPAPRAAPPVTTTTLPGHLHVDDAGSGNGVPVVFLHGFAGDGRQWSKQLRHVRTGHRALAVDLRGHGRSPRPLDGDYTVDSMAADLARVLDDRRLGRFVMVGHSMGGAVAIEYAGRHPDRVAGLVAVAAPGRTPPEQAQQVITKLQSNYEETASAYWQRLLGNATPDTRRQVLTGMAQFPREESMRIIRALFAYDPGPALLSYRGPKLSITPPGHDGPAEVHRLDPTVRHETIAGTSHWIQMDRPAELNAVLDRFLESIRTTSASASR